MSAMKDIGAYIKSLNSIPQNAGTTGGTAVNGAQIDRLSDLTSNYNSCKVIIPFSYIKATGPTISVSPQIQDSPEGSTWTSLATGAAVTVAAGTAATAATVGVAELDVDLTTAERYLRVRCLPQITTVSTVNALNIQGLIVFGGGDELPAA